MMPYPQVGPIPPAMPPWRSKDKNMLLQIAALSRLKLLNRDSRCPAAGRLAKESRVKSRLEVRNSVVVLRQGVISIWRPFW